MAYVLLEQAGDSYKYIHTVWCVHVKRDIYMS